MRETVKVFVIALRTALRLSLSDSTSEYISGAEVETEEGIRVGGLRCVTILVGVYDRKNGAPILGVVNQPFAITLTQGPIR